VGEGRAREGGWLRLGIRASVFLNNPIVAICYFHG
jgi:hypothetical protein